MSTPKNLRVPLIVLVCMASRSLYAQDYNVSLLPDSLKANAHCVIRESSRILTLSDVNRGALSVRNVITILDREGEEYSEIVIPYDKDSRVSIKEVFIYDSAGKKVKTFKQSEIDDIPAVGSSELYSDSRVKYLDADYPTYPYTLAYEYETTRQNMISYGVWQPLSGYNTSVVSSVYEIKYPKGIQAGIRKVNFGRNTPGIISNESGARWETANLVAIEEEPLDVSLGERVPAVYLMPAKLQYDKYEGNAGTWSEFSKWIYSLYEGRDKLAEEETVKVDLQLKDIADTLERIRTLYRYMQNRTRYVAVTLGIGGFQPFDAKSVYETGYGDCKALTNYMHSLLKYAGIESYPALVAAGGYRIDIFRDFPNFSQFNHVILCIPFRGDTIWLECTDQKIPFGFLGNFTDDRDVLLVKNDKGSFARTSRYSGNDNMRSCRSEFIIDQKGTAECRMTTSMAGLQYDNVSFLLNTGFEEQKKWLLANSSLPSLQIRDFSISGNRESKPSLTIRESSVSTNFCSFSGNYMILTLNMINVQRPLQKMTRQRYSDILIGRSFTDYDTMIYRIPPGYRYESLPKGNSINSEYGSYSMTVSGDETTITCIRKMSIREGKYRPSEYNRMYDFILAVSKEDKSKVLLVKK